MVEENEGEGDIEDEDVGIFADVVGGTLTTGIEQRDQTSQAPAGLGTQ